jgi:hypothetical protein
MTINTQWVEGKPVLVCHAPAAFGLKSTERDYYDFLFLRHHISSIASLPYGQLEEFLDMCHEAMSLRDPRADLLFFKPDKILIVSLLSTLKEISIQLPQYGGNHPGPDEMPVEQAAYPRMFPR